MSLAMKSHVRRYMKGIGLLLVSAACVALYAMTGKLLTHSFDLWTMICLRFTLPTLILGWIAVMVTQTWRFDYKCYGRTLLSRVCFVVASQYAFFYCLTQTSVLDATLLFMTTPLFVPFISHVVDRHPVQAKVWLSLVLGFIGILCILKPSAGILGIPALVGLSAGLFNACAQVSLHRLTRCNSPVATTLHTQLIASVITIIPVLIIDHMAPFIALMDTSHSLDLLLFIALSLLLISNQMLRSGAYSQVKRTMMLSPFMYVTILFTGLLDWWVFNHTPDLLTYIGASFIIGSGLLMVLWPERRGFTSRFRSGAAA